VEVYDERSDNEVSGAAPPRAGGPSVTDDLVPGEIRVEEGSVTLNEGRETAEVTVGNTGDRPVQVGSHFHFFEANAALAFDREAAYGMRLNVPAGTAVRFEPGDERTVELVAIGGKRRAYGMNGLVNGSVDGDPAAALERARTRGFRDAGADAAAGERADVDADDGEPE
jgi:urease subunit beta